MYREEWVGIMNIDNKIGEAYHHFCVDRGYEPNTLLLGHEDLRELLMGRHLTYIFANLDSGVDTRRYMGMEILVLDKTKHFAVAYVLTDD